MVYMSRLCRRDACRPLDPTAQSFAQTAYVKLQTSKADVKAVLVIQMLQDMSKCEFVALHTMAVSHYCVHMHSSTSVVDETSPEQHQTGHKHNCLSRLLIACVQASTAEHLSTRGDVSHAASAACYGSVSGELGVVVWPVPH